MKIYCAHSNNWHDVTPTAMAIIIEAFQDGDLQRAVPQLGGWASIENLCILDAITDERLEKFRTRYPGNTITASEHKED